MRGGRRSEQLSASGSVVQVLRAAGGHLGNGWNPGRWLLGRLAKRERAHLGAIHGSGISAGLRAGLVASA